MILSSHHEFVKRLFATYLDESVRHDLSCDWQAEVRQSRKHMASLHGWFYWALLSAAFAALTAIFAKIGLEGVDSDFATLIRTSVIGLTLTGFVYWAGKWSNPFALRPKT